MLRNRSSIVTTGPLCRGRCLCHHGKSSENWHWPAWNPLNHLPLLACSRLRAPHSQLHIKSSQLAGHVEPRQHAKFLLFRWHILLQLPFTFQIWHLSRHKHWSARPVCCPRQRTPAQCLKLILHLYGARRRLESGNVMSMRRRNSTMLSRNCTKGAVACSLR